MRIFLDTNVLPLDGDVDSFEIMTMTALADEHGHTLTLPSMVLIEAQAQRRIKAQAAYNRLQAAVAESRRFGGLDIDPDFRLPMAEDSASRFEAALRQRFQIVELPSGVAEEALRRSVERIPPAHREGPGGVQDAAIWLTIKSQHLSGEDCAFVTSNRSDFSAPTDRSTLHPNLLAELGERASSFQYFASSEDFVAALAPKQDCELSYDNIVNSAIVQTEVINALTTSAGGRGTFEPEGLAKLKQIVRSGCYALQSHVLAILHAVWEIRGTETVSEDSRLPTEPSGAEHPTWLTVSDVRVRATLQMWLRLAPGGQEEPTFARVHSVRSSETTFTRRDHALVMPGGSTKYGVLMLAPSQED